MMRELPPPLSLQDRLRRAILRRRESLVGPLSFGLRLFWARSASVVGRLQSDEPLNPLVLAVWSDVSYGQILVRHGCGGWS